MSSGIQDRTTTGFETDNLYFFNANIEFEPQLVLQIHPQTMANKLKKNKGVDLPLSAFFSRVYGSVAAKFSVRSSQQPKHCKTCQGGQIVLAQLQPQLIMLVSQIDHHCLLSNSHIHSPCKNDSRNNIHMSSLNNCWSICQNQCRYKLYLYEVYAYDSLHTCCKDMKKDQKEETDQKETNICVSFRYLFLGFKNEQDENRMKEDYSINVTMFWKYIKHIICTQCKSNKTTHSGRADSNHRAHFRQSKLRNSQICPSKRKTTVLLQESQQIAIRRRLRILDDALFTSSEMYGLDVPFML